MVKSNKSMAFFFLLKEMKMVSEFNLSATLLKRLAVDVISRMIMEYLQLKLCFVLVSIHKIYKKKWPELQNSNHFFLSYSSFFLLSLKLMTSS